MEEFFLCFALQLTCQQKDFSFVVNTHSFVRELGPGAHLFTASVTRQRECVELWTVERAGTSGQNKELNV
jgi:hypothetical protein